MNGMEPTRKVTFSVIFENGCKRGTRKTEDWLGPRRDTGMGV